MDKLFKLFICGAAIFMIAGCVDSGYVVDDENPVNSEVTLFEQQGLDIPLGSTAMIYLKDMINLETEDATSIVSVDQDGNYRVHAESQTPSPFTLTIPSYTFPAFTTAGTGCYTYNFPQELVGQSKPEGMQEIVSIAAGYTISVDQELPEGLAWLGLTAVDLPVSLDVSCTYGAFTIEAGSCIEFPSSMSIETEDQRFTVKDKNTLVFGENVKIGVTGTKFTVNIVSIDFDKYNTSHRLVIEDPIMLSGKIKLEGDDFLFVPASMDVEILASSSPATVKELTGKVDMSFDASEIALQFSDIPDYLRSVSIILSDPSLSFTIDNQSPFSASSKEATVTAVRSADEEVSFTLDPLSIKPFSASTISLTKDQATLLSAKIPQELRLSGISASTDADEECHIKAGETYSVTASYCFDAPIAFDNGTAMDFEYTVKNFNLDLAQYIKNSTVSLKMDFINAIPMSMEIGCDVVDEEGAVIPGYTITTDQTLEAGTVESPTTTAVKLSISANGEASGYIGNLRIKFRGSVPASMSGKCWKEQSYIKLDNAMISIEGGISL